MTKPAVTGEPTVPPTDLPRRGDYRPRRAVWPLLAVAAVVVVTAVVLRGQGRSWWCSCGQPFPWAGDTRSPHNSQHLFDPYSFTHVLHGVVLCGLLTWGCPRLAPPWRLGL